MDAILPDRITAQSKGWTHQVAWTDEGRPCFRRCTSVAEATGIADVMSRFTGVKDLVVIDLREALQIN